MSPFTAQGQKVNDWIAAADLRVREMDDIDRAAGARTPEECGLTELLRTALTAIATGYAMGDWDVVGDGVVLLLRAERLSRLLE